MSTVKQNVSTTTGTRTARTRGTELGLLIFSAVILGIALVALQLSQGNDLDSNVAILVGGYVAVFGLAHVVLCFKAPYADQIMLPVAALLNGIGLVMIYRLDLADDRTLANGQVMWTVLAIVIFTAVIWLMRSHHGLQSYAYLLGLGALVLYALPAIWPSALMNSNINDEARVWIGIGPFTIQPNEFAKVMLLIFFAALLVNKRALFATAGTRFLGLQFPRLRDLGPILLIWGLAILTVIAQNDFGPAMLLFLTVLGMLYMATGRASWLVIGVALAALGAVGAYMISDTIQIRVANFIDPLSYYDSTGYQLSQALFGISYGGVTGTGLGEGYPSMIPVAESDFILSALGEELGLIGLGAILLLFAVLVTRGMIAALQSPDSFGKLTAAGLSLTLAVQVFVVTGGVTRLMPMSGLTTPFISQGGSSLLASYILLAILLKISHDARAPKSAAPQSSGGADGAPIEDKNPSTRRGAAQ